MPRAASIASGSGTAEGGRMHEERTRPASSAASGEEAIAALRDELAALSARLDALERRAVSGEGGAGRLAETGRTLARRAAAAWNAWRGPAAAAPAGTGPGSGAVAGTAARDGWVGIVILAILGLIAALLAVELAEEIGKALRRLWRWIT